MLLLRLRVLVIAILLDPEAIKFVNESARPKAETLIALKAEMAALAAKWKAVRASVTDSPDMLDDGRQANGVSSLVVTFGPI